MPADAVTSFSHIRDQAIGDVGCPKGPLQRVVVVRRENEHRRTNSREGSDNSMNLGRWVVGVEDLVEVLVERTCAADVRDVLRDTRQAILLRKHPLLDRRGLRRRGGRPSARQWIIEEAGKSLPGLPGGR